MKHDTSDMPNSAPLSRAATDADDPRVATGATLMLLSDMDNFEIADGEPDIRGWDVRSTDGHKLGEVGDLLVDPERMMVRYIEMKLEDDFAIDETHQHAVLPIGSARLDEDEDTVLVSLSAVDLRGMPPYLRGNFTREHEDTLIRRLNHSSEGAPATQAVDDVDFYGQSHFDDQTTFAGRRNQSGRNVGSDARYLTRSEKRDI